MTEGLPPPQIEPEDVMRALEEILASAAFRQSDRQRRFLRFVVEEELAGRGGQIGQFLIAEEVFDRDASFDPATDAIVRVEARRLRGKLTEYYADDANPLSEVVIDLPKGRYRPRITRMRPTSGPDTAPDYSADAAPVIAVLPFDNLGGAEEDGYLGAGIAEDIITDLSKLSALSVVSRHSSFVYGARSMPIRDIGEDLGARYVLEGSVRRIGDRLRVTAQLIDAVADRHLWAERYDRDAATISDMLDEVVRHVVVGLDVTFGALERRRKPRRGGVTTEAHDLLLCGIDRFQRFTAEDVRAAIALLQTAVNADPAFVDTRTWLARMLVYRAISGGEDDPDAGIEAAVEVALAGQAIDPADPHAQAVLGWALLWQGRADDAIQHTASAAAGDPSFADGHLWHAMTLASLGRGEEARRAVEQGMRLNPHYSVTYLHALALAEFARGDLAEALLLSERCHRRSPGFTPGQILRAVLLLQLGHRADAAEAAASATAMNTPTRRRISQFFAEPRLRALYSGCLREVGLLDRAAPPDNTHSNS